VGDFTANRPVFLNFCRDALDKIHGLHSFEADKLREELQALCSHLEGWAHMVEPPDKDRTIAAVMDAYRRALDLSAQQAPTGTSTKRD
jgi:hypothetical protein